MGRHRKYDYLAKTAEPGLVALAQAGDDRAFSELVHRRQGFVRKLTMSLCNNPATADDMAQETFLTAWRKLHTLKSPGAFGGWLRQIAIHLFLQYIRRLKAKKEDAYTWERETDSLSINPAVRLDLHKALKKLRPEERLCVVLSYSERLSHSEICAATNLPLGTVKSHIVRGSKQLKNHLKAYKGTL